MALRKTELYASVCIIGALIYYAAMKWDGSQILAANLCCFGTILIRFFVMYTHVTLPAGEPSPPDKTSDNKNSKP